MGNLNREYLIDCGIDYLRKNYTPCVSCNERASCPQVGLFDQCGIRAGGVRQSTIFDGDKANRLLSVSGLTKKFD